MDIRDIARLSGYGVGTVSRVLNGHPNVSNRARKKVLAVVEEQGYEPNGNARYLKAQARTPIAIFVKGSRNMLFFELLEEIEFRLAASGEDAQVNYLDEDENEVKRALDFQRIRNPKGIIFLGGDPDYFKESFAEVTAPSVLITNSAAGLGFPNLSSVRTDDAAAARCAIDELVGAGHKRIGIVGGNRVSGQISGIRANAAADELGRCGLEFDFDRDYCPGHYTMDDGYLAIEHLLRRAPDITAVFALSDVIALGCVRAAKDMGLSVPEDLSIVGFDGIDLARFSVPRLTTIQQDTHKLACYGVDTILAAINGELTEPAHYSVPFTILKRESVRRL